MILTANDVATAIMESECLDDRTKKAIRAILEDNIAKNNRIAQLEAEVEQVKIKVNQLERYESKDRLIFRNLPIGANGSLIMDVVAFIRNVMQVECEPHDLKACHALGNGTTQQPPGIVAKFLYNDQKERIWSRKRFLKFFKNPMNGKPVFLYERLTKYDINLKETAESQNLLVTTYKSAPMLHFEEGGRTRSHTINSVKDIDELKQTAKKNMRRLNTQQQTSNAPLSNPVPASNVFVQPSTPLPSLFRQPNFQPRTPISTGIPGLKRVREKTTFSDQESSLVEELRSRKDNKDDLLDYVMGLIGDTPNAKESNLDTIIEQPFHVEESEEFRTQD